MTVAAKRRRLAPEVVQTSAMDCGPAALKCLLEGHGIPVSYGRLREACQTDVDGTSIDTIEVVANQLGITAEQMMIPVDHLFLESAQSLPALVVVKQSSGSTHFVVAWARQGRWLQVMDPSIGRRWVSREELTQEIYVHELSVPAAQWREWTASEDFLIPLRERLAALEITGADASSLIERARKDDGWFSLGALDAAVRLVQSVHAAGGVKHGTEALKLLTALFERTCASPLDIYCVIPRHYWSAAPDPAHVDPAHPHLLLRGAVILRIGASRAPAPAANDAAAKPLPPELAAALSEKPAHPLRKVWDLLTADGLLAPAALLGVTAIAVCVLLVEALLFRGVFDIAWALSQASQRAGAALGLLVLVVILLALEIPIILETLRLGRHLEVRLRMALLEKLPNLADRYFQSRPVSDMAERSHSLQVMRIVPSLALQFLQACWELVLTLVCVIFIDPPSAWLVLAIAGIPALVSLAIQPLLNERDLRVRNHAGALHVFYLDAMLGLVPIRTHGAEKAVSRQHEGLLVEWMRSSVGLVRMKMLADAVQALACMSLAGYLLIDHFVRAGGVTGADLLLVYWVLKLPAIGRRVSSFAHQYPAQRNVLLRLLEPLAAPAEVDQQSIAPHSPSREHKAARIEMRNAGVIAAGHTILRNVELDIAAGEHVVVVGSSGAGKSTLIGLLLGWHRLAAGELRIDGERTDSAMLHGFRRNVAWVDPGIQLWNRPFAENLAYACEDDGLTRMGGAIDAATLRGVLQKLPQGLQSYLGEGGGLLSGGEGQRVRLARALMQQRVRLALLDEPFRGMDRGQRAALLAQARQWWKDVTLLCVTHDVSETRAFDRVLVIEDGCIVEDGTPATLAARASRYRQLLDAEELVQKQLWHGTQWRHLRMHDGRLQAGSP